MALIHCPECGKEISDQAVSCPHCGYPISSRVDVSDLQEHPVIEQPQDTTPEDDNPEQQPKEAAPSTESTTDKSKSSSMPLKLVLCIVIFAFVVILVSRTGGWTRDTPAVKSRYITAEEYDQIKNGMNYAEVVSIVGGEGELTAESEVMGVKLEIVTWYAKSPKGANANVTFRNNKVISKAQFLLE